MIGDDALDLHMYNHYRNPGLYRVPAALSSAAFGKVLRSVKSLFTECRTLDTEKHSAKTALPSGKHSAKMALGKGSLAAIYSCRRFDPGGPWTDE
jgi:hypothetical protein